MIHNLPLYTSTFMIADNNNNDDDDDGASGPQETDVVEVWFSGCHCGTFALQHRELYGD